MNNARYSEAKTRLNTWKEVGAFFGRSERTVKRWESERGLPVHRLPGQSRSHVYAEVSELETWLKGAPDRDEAGAPVSVPAAARGRGQAWPYLVLAGFVVIAVLGLAAGGPWRHRPEAVPDRARGFYIQGMKDWQLRTPDSLSRAVDEFNTAIRIDPDYAEAYVGLANCYNLMREYTAMPDAEAYPLAKSAAERAIRLNGQLAGAHAALAFTDFYGSWDYQGARGQYQRALELDPDDANIEHWYATFLMSNGDFGGALSHIDHALAIDPDSVSTRADRGLILFLDHQEAAALAALRTLETDSPAFRSPHSYLAYIYSIDGDDRAFIHESQIKASLAGDPVGESVAAAAARGLASGGHDGMLRAMLQVRLDEFRHGTASAFTVADLYAMLNDQPNALVYLKLSVDRHEGDAIDIKIDPRLAPVRDSQGFRDQLARLHP